MTTRIMQRFEFDAAHRILGDQGGDQYLHGHRFVVEFHIEQVVTNYPHTAEQLFLVDELGRVIGPATVEKIIGGWISHHFDHNVILHPEDPLTKIWRASGEKDAKASDPVYELAISVFAGRAPYVMSDRRPNPTVENIAAELFFACKGFFSDTLIVRHVVVWETPDRHAYFSG